MDVDRLKEGDKVWFLGEKQGYTVQAASDNGEWAVCTKPFNLKHTVLYSIVNLKLGLRGIDNHFGYMGYETKRKCKVACRLFYYGYLEFSGRNRPIPLHIERIDRAA